MAARRSRARQFRSPVARAPILRRLRSEMILAESAMPSMVPGMETDARQASNEFTAMLRQNPGVRDVFERWVLAASRECNQSASALAAKALFDESHKPSACAMYGRCMAFDDIRMTIEQAKK